MTYIVIPSGNLLNFTDKEGQYSDIVPMQTASGLYVVPSRVLEDEDFIRRSPEKIALLRTFTTIKLTAEDFPHSDN